MYLNYVHTAHNDYIYTQYTYIIYKYILVHTMINAASNNSHRTASNISKHIDTQAHYRKGCLQPGE
jgi:hypothetical protein